MKWVAAGSLLAAGFAALPLLTSRSDLLNLGVQIFLAIILAQSWNLLGGYAGQINLGHAAYFGLGALVTRFLWVGGMPLLLALPAGALVAMAFGCLIGVPAFRLRGAYFRHRHSRISGDSAHHGGKPFAANFHYSRQRARVL